MVFRSNIHYCGKPRAVTVLPALLPTINCSSILGHFLNTGDSWQMLISEGEAIDFPCLPCDEIHAMIKVEAPVEEYVKKVLEKGVAHHLIVAHGSVTEELKKVAKFMKIEHEVIK
jgi:L-arabinose isomerase